MRKVLKYILYLVVSFGIGYVSMRGECDYVGSLSNTIVQVMVMLLTLYTTISTQLIGRLMHYKEVKKADIREVLDAMKRNVLVEAICIAVTFCLLATYSWLMVLLDQFAFAITLVRNSVVVFVLLYFVYIVVDSSLGLYDLLKEDSKDY